MPNKRIQRSHLQRWRDEHEVMLNQVQRDEVSRYFSRAAEEDGMEGWPQEDPIQIGVDNGQLVINGLYLDSKGDWCTFPEVKEEEKFYLVPMTNDDIQTVKRALNVQASPYLPKPLVMVTQDESAAVEAAIQDGTMGGIHSKDD